MNSRVQQLLTEFFTIFRFAIVGVAATAVHMLVALLLLNLAAMAPLPANILGFLFAFGVSLVGHSQWTFRGHSAEFKSSAARLLFVSFCGFLLNNGVLLVLVENSLLGDNGAIIFAILVVPPATYLLNKFWVFKS